MILGLLISKTQDGSWILIPCSVSLPAIPERISPAAIFLSISIHILLLLAILSAHGITPCGPFLLLSFVFILFMARSGPNIEDVTARQRKPDVKGKRIDQKMPDVCFPVLESHFLFPLDNQIIQKEREM